VFWGVMGWVGLGQGKRGEGWGAVEKGGIWNSFGGNDGV